MQKQRHTDTRHVTGISPQVSLSRARPEQFKVAIMSPWNELLRSALSRQTNPIIDHPAEPAIHGSNAAVATLMLIHTHPCLEYVRLHLKA